jgi:hypothetical protein
MARADPFLPAIWIDALGRASGGEQMGRWDGLTDPDGGGHVTKDAPDDHSIHGSLRSVEKGWCTSKGA